MAKQKAAPAATKRAKTRRTGVATRRAQGARTKAAPKRRAKASRTTTRKAVRPAKKTPVKTRKAVKPAPKKVARKTTVRKAAVRRAPVRKAAARKATRKVVVRKIAPRKAATPKMAPLPAARVSKPAPRVTAAKAVKKPALDRARRTIADDDSIPSSLDLDRTASSARSGRHELARHHLEAPQEDLDITAGDVDADAASAYSVGDEAPGGDSPTPDQDVVDEIGHALGMEYDDAEELDGAGKISGRDTDRWELDPESSEDFDERD